MRKGKSGMLSFKLSLNPVLLCILLSTAANSCKKAEPIDFYLECYIDGKKYVPKPNCPSCRTTRVLGDTMLLIGAQNFPEYLKFLVHDLPVQTKTYQLGDIGSLSTSVIYDAYGPEISYSSKSGKMGWLSISELNKEKQTIKGSFKFVAFNKEGTDSVVVDRGKFWLKYTTY